MRPIDFKYSNKILQPSGQKYSSNVAYVDSLPIWTDGEQCISCWKMSLRERLSALLFGRAWLSLLSGQTQIPASISISRTHLQADDIKACDLGWDDGYNLEYSNPFTAGSDEWWDYEQGYQEGKAMFFAEESTPLSEQLALVEEDIDLP